MKLVLEVCLGWIAVSVVVGIAIGQFTKGETMSKLTSQDTCLHCFHPYEGPYMAVLPNGYVLEQCCKCEKTRQIHRAHRSIRAT
jgi:hypothetical protein